MKKFAVAVAVAMLCSCAIAQDYYQQPRQPQTFGGFATVKVSSSPRNCTVYFRQQMFEKRDLVLVWNDVEPNKEYEIKFRLDGRELSKNIVVRPGDEIIVFGNFNSGTAITLPNVGGSSVPGIGELAELSEPQDYVQITNASDQLLFKQAEELRTNMNIVKKNNVYSKLLTYISKF